MMLCGMVWWLDMIVKGNFKVILYYKDLNYGIVVVVINLMRQIDEKYYKFFFFF